MAYNFEFRIEGITRKQAEAIMESNVMLAEVFRAQIAGGFVEVDDDQEPEDVQKDA
jgi:hypothetical protein